MRSQTKSDGSGRELALSTACKVYQAPIQRESPYRRAYYIQFCPGMQGEYCALFASCRSSPARRFLFEYKQRGGVS